MKIEKRLNFLRTSKQAVSRSAVIDIGSNSVRIVVYEGPSRAPAVIFNEKVAAGLGRGLAIDGRIAAEDAERGLVALRRYALLAKHMDVKTIQCVATGRTTSLVSYGSSVRSVFRSSAGAWPWPRLSR